MRKTKEVTIVAEGRDKDKKFLITELPASQAEKWAVRALSALAKSGVNLPDSAQAMGMEAIARLGFEALANVDYQDLEPLLDEMMTCVQAVPGSNMARRLVEEDIEEVGTRLSLRREIFELHTGFFGNAAP